PPTAKTLDALSPFGGTRPTGYCGKRTANQSVFGKTSCTESSLTYSTLAAEPLTLSRYSFTAFSALAMSSALRAAAAAAPNRTTAQQDSDANTKRRMTLPSLYPGGTAGVRPRRDCMPGTPDEDVVWDWRGIGSFSRGSQNRAPPCGGSAVLRTAAKRGKV